MVVLLLLLSLVVLACGCSLHEKSPSTWHAPFMCVPCQQLWWSRLLGTTTIVVMVDVMSLVDVVVVISCCRVVVVVVVVVNIERDV